MIPCTLVHKNKLKTEKLKRGCTNYASSFLFILYTIRFGRPIPILIPNDVTLTSLKSTDSRTRICEATQPYL